MLKAHNASCGHPDIALGLVPHPRGLRCAMKATEQGIVCVVDLGQVALKQGARRVLQHALKGMIYSRLNCKAKRLCGNPMGSFVSTQILNLDATCLFMLNSVSGAQCESVRNH